MSGTLIYIAVGEKTAQGIENTDSFKDPLTPFKTGSFQESEFAPLTHNGKKLTIYSADVSDTRFASSLFKLESKLATWKANPGIALQTGLADFIFSLEHPSTFHATLSLTEKQKDWASTIFGTELQLTPLAPDQYTGTLSFNRQELTALQIEKLRAFNHHLESYSSNLSALVNDYGIGFLNVYLFAKSIIGDEWENEARMRLRSFVQRLQTYGQIGIGNSQLVTQKTDGTGTTQFALHECNPAQGHYTRGCAGWPWQPQTQPQSRTTGMVFDGPNQFLLGGGLAGNLLNWFPQNHADASPGQFSAASAGFQFYWMAELNFSLLPYAQGTFASFDLQGGLGFRTDLASLQTGDGSTLVFLPGLEALYGGSYLSLENKSGTVMDLRLNTLGWYHNGWAAELLLQFGEHDWQGAHSNNEALNARMSGDQETFQVLLRIPFPLSPLQIPQKHAQEAATPPPLRAVECPAVQNEPSSLARMLVISLPDILFQTNEPTVESLEKLKNSYEAWYPTRTPLGLQALQTALGETIFQPQLMNLQSLGIIAEKLNSDELKNYKIRINGHTDSRGGDEDNLALSQRRANAVWYALIMLGVDLTRLTVEGFGESRPKIPEDFALGTADQSEAQRTNRRIEFVIEGMK